MIGSYIKDRYEILSELGKGSFGTVYRVLDHRLNRQVALKLINSTLNGTNAPVDLAKEAELTAKLNHPGVVTIYDLGKHEERLFLVSEIVEGISLEEVLADGIPPLSQTLAWFKQIARTMAYAHGEGIVHRDLSLANISLVGGKNGSIKIMDFGLGSKTDGDDDWAEGMQIGTLTTMAPEQVIGAATSPATDIYAIGAGMYRLLTGKPPFTADHKASFEYSICHDDPAILPSSLPGRLNELIMRCLMKQPQDRPENFEEILEILAGIDVPRTTGSIQPATTPIQVVGNPFLNRAMIQNPDDFYGRKREIRKIFARIDAENPQCVSMVGDRRIGKSSILAYVYNEANRARYMVHAAETDFIFMDFQSNFDFDQTSYMKSLFEQLAIFGGVNRNTEPTFPELEKILDRRSAKGRRLVILMDEFERITANPKFERWFFSSLRSAANHHKVSYVTSSGAELQKMCHTQEISDSPFFNIFSNLLVGPLLRPEAVDLVSDASKRAGQPMGQYADPVISMAGLFPLYLQIACSCLFDMRLDNPDSEPDWGQLKSAFIEEATPHFEFTWGELPEGGQDVLGLVASGETLRKEQAHLYESLVSAGLIIDDGDGVRLFGSVFQEFVVRHWVGKGKKSFFGRLFGR